MLRLHPFDHRRGSSRLVARFTIELAFGPRFNAAAPNSIWTDDFHPFTHIEGHTRIWYTASQILSMRELPMLCAPNTISQMSRVRKPQHMGKRQGSDKNPLDLIQADRIAGAVIELGGARRLMRRNLLCVFNCTTVLEVGGNARSPERVAAGRVRQSSLPGAALDHTAPANIAGGCRCRQYLQPVQPPLGQMALTIEATKERTFGVLGDSCGRQIGVQVSLGVMMCRHFMSFAALR